MERLVQLMKRGVKYKRTDHPELVAVNRVLLSSALARSQQASPHACLPFDELVPSYSNKPLRAPKYDEHSTGGVQLLGAGRALPDDLSTFFSDAFEQLLEKERDEYSAFGWTGNMKSTFLAYSKAILPSSDIMTCTGRNQTSKTDNSWALISYALGNTDQVELCVAHMLNFILVRSVWVAALDSDAALEMADEPPPLKFAIVDLWKADSVSGPGLCSEFKMAQPEAGNPGSVPDLLMVQGFSLPKERALARKLYFGKVIINLQEFTSQLVPTRLTNDRRYFLTANKASGMS